MPAAALRYTAVGTGSSERAALVLNTNGKYLVAGGVFSTNLSETGLAFWPRKLCRDLTRESPKAGPTYNPRVLRPELGAAH